ncbi:alternative oxidase [Rhodoferax antarcticus]|uniref:alternative oxidase n=1 Tax=Rhodoferax antarcticus TaxID=81479 RepID=UPI00094FB983|nr:alternative oxidase [Rhodoferax antarcticus]APW47022.1 hypothetical protein RA876_12375 [Rhodoferax antarcticus]
MPAPQVAIDYCKPEPGTLLRDVIVLMRADEANHRDVNHQFADELAGTRRTTSSSRSVKRRLRCLAGPTLHEPCTKYVMARPVDWPQTRVSAA